VLTSGVLKVCLNNPRSIEIRCRGYSTVLGSKVQIRTQVLIVRTWTCPHPDWLWLDTSWLCSKWLLLGLNRSLTFLHHYISSSKLATLYPHEEDWCWWMWCSLCSDLFPYYPSEYVLPVLFYFLRFFLFLNFVEKGYPDWRKFNFGVLRR